MTVAGEVAGGGGGGREGISHIPEKGEDFGRLA